MIQLMILAIVFTICLASLGIVTYLYYLEKKRNRKIMERINRIDIKPIEDKVNKIREDENKYFVKLFELDMLLENYRKATLIIGNKVDSLEGKFKELEKLPKDYERTYRDVVRKVLEMDNKFTDKFKMVAEAVIKLRDEKK